MSVTHHLQQACTPAHFAAARALFRAYAESLPISLDFQHFEQEMLSLEEQYAPPHGCLLLLCSPGHEALGCCGVRRWHAHTAELKRMYLRPALRGTGWGQRLLDAACDAACQQGYTHLRLDTLPSMQAAIALYLRNGFLSIPAYRANPVSGTLYLEKHLCS